MKSFLFIFICTVFSSNALAALEDISVNLQASQYDGEYLGVVGIGYDFTEQFSTSVDIDTDKYIEIGASYSTIIDTWYLETYVRYGFGDELTTEASDGNELVYQMHIYDLGFLAGKVLTNNVFAYLDTSLQYRAPHHNIALPALVGDNTLAYELSQQTEWNNTLAVDYTPLDWLSLGVSYNFDLLLGDHPYEDSLRDSVDVSVSLNLPYVTPYARYTKGEYRVRPGRPIQDSSYTEVGFYFNF
ncbi:hypothetical protein VIN01S_29450 [Vibrio inusitatus NBRC 102082]|uniref:Outer membrane protein beta-barrel domain-containing protein n=1 Tax=Vibrio inusitatus NBRC 102082 TaxID=1219070 RepID=A0A4Y3HYR5_9VIBR|nr:hypothetical protein [Vibrio inusitatus]GEA52141.1 hypothetical protein VIN01S_29450 [Vibrio inusitatus NBRC 102082]